MDKSKSPTNALIVTAGSILVGALYFTYISNVSFPHDMVRIVPFVWLAGSIIGLKMSLSTLHSTAWYMRFIFFIVAVSNTFFACTFALGALMGD